MKVDLNTLNSVELLPERAFLWNETLVVADLHWGKSDTFQQHGIPIPSNLLATELERLLEVARRKKASRVIVLGDLIHSPDFLSGDVMEQTRRFFSERTFELILVEGNHDRRLKLPAHWDLQIVKEPFCEEGLAFCHHQDVSLPPGKEDFYRWSGHLHPTVVLEHGKDRLRLPCFVVGKTQGIVPAFSDFTRGVSHSFRSFENREKKFFAIADREVIAI